MPQAKKAPVHETVPHGSPAPVATSVQPPKMAGRGKVRIHTDEVITAIAEGAAKGWTTNNLTYKTKSAAQGSLQGVKDDIVKAGYASATSDLAGRVWESEEGVWVWAVGAKSAVR